MLTLLCTGPQDFVLKTGEQFKEALWDESGAISVFSKQDFKSFGPSSSCEGKKHQGISKKGFAVVWVFTGVLFWLEL